MTQIDPEAPRESILDSLDDANFRRPPAPTVAAACPDCTTLANRIAEQQAEFTRESLTLERMRKNFADVTVDQDRRVPQDPQVVRQKIALVAQAEADVRRQAQKVEGIERGIDVLRGQLEACNKTCSPPQPGPGGAVVTPDPTGAHLTRCPACSPMGNRLGDIEARTGRKAAAR